MFTVPGKTATLRRVQRQRGLVRPKPGTLHAAYRLWILHESAPDEAGPRIFRHHHGDSSINSNDVVVVPILDRIEGVHKAVLGPGGPIASSDVVQHAHYGLGQEWQ